MEINICSTIVSSNHRKMFCMLCCDGESRRDDSGKSDLGQTRTPPSAAFAQARAHRGPSPELSVLLLFQNIAYTSSKNYQKWFYNRYQVRSGELTRRERSYSLDSEIDFDECFTYRPAARPLMLETIYESATDDYISNYYTPLTSELLPYFESFAPFFQPSITSVTVQFSGYLKLKYFKCDDQIFLTIMLPRSHSISSESTTVGAFSFSNTLIEFWDALERNPTSRDLIDTLPHYGKVNIVSHYKNTFFTDFFVYKLVSQHRASDVRYLSLLPDKLHDDKFYKLLDRQVDLVLFSERSTPIRSHYRIETCYETCCTNRSNYRRNLKRHSKRILDTVAPVTYL